MFVLLTVWLQKQKNVAFRRMRFCFWECWDGRWASFPNRILLHRNSKAAANLSRHVPDALPAFWQPLMFINGRISCAFTTVPARGLWADVFMYKPQLLTYSCPREKGCWKFLVERHYRIMFLSIRSSLFLIKKYQKQLHK